MLSVEQQPTVRVYERHDRVASQGLDLEVLSFPRIVVISRSICASTSQCCKGRARQMRLLSIGGFYLCVFGLDLNYTRRKH